MDWPVTRSIQCGRPFLKTKRVMEQCQTKVTRPRLAFIDYGREDTFVEFPAGTRVADDAAGCSVGEIVKSMIFGGNCHPVLLLSSGTQPS